MKRTITSLSFALILLCASVGYGATFTSVQTGKWHESTTWDRGAVPGPTDDVVIDGDTVTINKHSGNITVNSIHITNSADRGNSFLFVRGDDVLNINGNLTVTSENFDWRVELNLSGDVNIFVGGSLDFSRSNDNAHNQRLRLSMGGTARLVVGGDFNFYYGNSNIYELYVDVYMVDTSYLEVGGNTQFNLLDGQTLDMSVGNEAEVVLGADFTLQQDGAYAITIGFYGNAKLWVKANMTLIGAGGNYSNTLNTYGSSKVVIDSSLILNSTATDEVAAVFMRSPSSKIEVKQDIVMSADSEGDVGLNLTQGGLLYIGGVFSRPDKYGILRMADDSKLIYNGSSQQYIAQEEMSGAGTDKFTFTNIEFANTSGLPMILTGPMEVTDSLVLTEGVLNTDSVNTITIADSAKIVGGGQNCYINGPLTKRGTSPYGTFVFPIGGGGVYAPVQIDTLYNSTDEYTIQYFNCPPPFGNNIDPSLDHISGQEYWSIQKAPGTPDVNLSLFWSDAAARGINDLGSLAVAFYNTTLSQWVSLGNGGTTGSASAAVSGSVSNDLNCPPPFGNGANFLTLGSTSDQFNVLPVELISFTAHLEEDIVAVKWETSFEENNDYFAVEKSTDGMNFELLGTRLATGNNSVVSNYYKLEDTAPAGGYNYYRLKQVDKDGTFYFSETIAISIDNHSAPVLFPNPVKHNLHIYTNGWSRRSNVQVDIFDQGGERIFSRSYPIQTGTFQVSASDIEGFIPGMYTLILKSASDVHTMNFLKL
ncbi:MAG: hypothetical protein AAF990_05745 [Bacteroidota bacterium]